MPTPAPIGHVFYSEPRAVQIRDIPEEDIKHMASAISGTVNLVATTVEDRNKILSSWSEIMVAINLKVEEIIGRE